METKQERTKIRAWLMYDWANSAFATTMMAAVLPIFYVNVAGSSLHNDTLASSYWGLTQTVAMLIVAVSSPVLGALADYSGLRMAFLRLFSLIGIAASALFAFVGEGDYLLASVLFIFAQIGFSSSSSFYDSLLPVLVPAERRDYISSKGYAFGYIGGGILLVVNLLMIQNPAWFLLPGSLAGTHLAFVTVAVWWFVFSLPLFRSVRDTRVNTGHRPGFYVNVAVSRTMETLRHMRRYPELLKFLLAFWFFNDGINTVITMATSYGATIGIETSDLIAALVITQFVGIPFTLLFGRLAERFGSVRSLYASLGVYVLIVILGYFMTSAIHFYALAVMVGFVQGGSQALARSLFSRLTPPSRTSEFFGFLNVSNKFSSILGPFVFSMVGLLTGSSRLAILSLVLFFAAGIAMLTRVNIDKGAREAEESEGAA